MGEAPGAELRRIVDVVPADRPDTVAAWWQAHPTIPVVTRDRDNALAKAMAAGAPNAISGADRSPLLQNLRVAFLQYIPSLRTIPPLT